MKTVYKILILFAVCLAIIIAIVKVVKSFEPTPKQKATQQVYEKFKEPYRKSDSTILAIDKDSIRAKHTDVENRRFNKR